MWGWRARHAERFSHDLFADLGNVSLLIFDSGTLEIRKVEFAGVSTFRPGFPIPTPNPDATPNYMRGALCDAWFHLTAIEEPIDIHFVTIRDYPTLEANRVKNLPQIAVQPCELRETPVTCWIVEL